MERMTLRLSQFLKKIFGLSLLPLAKFRDCFALDFISNLPNDKRVEQFCDYLLENYIDADSNFPSLVWTECTASSLGTIKAYESFHAHFNALLYSAHPTIFFLYLHCKIYRMRPTSEGEASLHEELRNQLQSKQRLQLFKNLDRKGLT